MAAKITEASLRSFVLQLGDKHPPIGLGSVDRTVRDPEAEEKRALHPIARLRLFQFGIRHLRQQFRRHEGSHLDFTQSCCVQGTDPALLVLGRHAGLDGLQPVARPDFADQNVRSGMGGKRHC